MADLAIDTAPPEPKKRPAFQFYPADWRKDVELRSCTVAARGLWIDILCLAHECEPYGHLVVNGRPMTAAQIAGQIGLVPAQCKKLLDELLSNGVARQTTEGAIYSKRMVDDERIRNARAAGGQAGAEHGIKGAKDGSKGGRPKQPKGGYETPLQGTEKPPPSSSSSSSTSVKENPSGSVAAVAAPAPSPPLKLPDLVAEGVDRQHAADWLTLRKAKRLPLTPTAWADTKAEGAKAGMTAAQTVASAVAHNWAGFKANWLQREAVGRNGSAVGEDPFDRAH